MMPVIRTTFSLDDDPAEFPGIRRENGRWNRSERRAVRVLARALRSLATALAHRWLRSGGRASKQSVRKTCDPRSCEAGEVFTPRKIDEVLDLRKMTEIGVRVETRRYLDRVTAMLLQFS